MSGTQIFIIVIILAVLVYDGLVSSLNQPTESTVMRAWAWKFNTFPFAAGLVLGHWFFNIPHPNYSAWGYAIPILGALGVWDLTWHFISKDKPEHPWYRWPGFYALIGIVAGMFLWGQGS